MLARKYWHKKITDEAILASVEQRSMSLDNPGFCLACGCEASGVEPDARNYECESCGSHQVFGRRRIADGDLMTRRATPDEQADRDRDLRKHDEPPTKETES